MKQFEIDFDYSLYEEDGARPVYIVHGAGTYCCDLYSDGSIRIYDYYNDEYDCGPIPYVKFPKYILKELKSIANKVQWDKITTEAEFNKMTTSAEWLVRNPI